MHSTPLVTIGIPTYNRAERLEHCLQRVLLQTYSNLEILISDNCSPDLAVKLVGEQYAFKDERIHYFRQDTNIGIEPNFNYVLSKGNGEYFMWMADDDHFDNEYIERCVQFLEADKSYVHVSGTPKYYSEAVYIFTEKSMTLSHKFGIARLFSFLWNVKKNGIFYGVYRREHIKNLNLKHVVAGDICFIAQVTQLGKMKMLPELFYHRSADGGTADRKSIIRLYGYNSLRKIFLEPYIAYTISRYSMLPQASFAGKLMLMPIIFVLFNMKLVVNSIKKRIK